MNKTQRETLSTLLLALNTQTLLAVSMSMANTPKKVAEIDEQIKINSQQIAEANTEFLAALSYLEIGSN